jgi:aminopeptidase YwaD
MRVRLFILIVFFALLSKVEAQDMSQVRQVIDTLCSESFHGRGYVFRGDKIAANYIHRKFSEIGLKPFRENFYQFFKMDINVFPERVRFKIGKLRLINGKDFIVNAISRAGKGKGRLWRLDSMIYTDKARQTKFLKEKVNQRILVLEEEDGRRMLDLPQKVIDKIYTAKAIIELKKNKLTAALSSQQLSNPTFEMTKADFEALYTQMRRSKKMRAQFTLDATLLKDYISQNVIGYVQGTAEPDSFLVVSAHYDHLGVMGKNVYFPGANDNASGISMLLELAKYFVKNPPKYSVAFMAFGAEEAGLIGSHHYVKYPLFPLERIKFLFNLDLVGTGDEGATVVNGTIFKKEFELLTQINQDRKYLPQIQVRGFAANSDHYFFTEWGVRSFFLYTLGGIRSYHDIYDRPETLPLTRYREVYRLIIDFLEGIESLKF